MKDILSIPYPEECKAESDWIRENAPIFECPDREFQEVYYYRWSVYRRHLRETDAGWLVTEFLNPGPGYKNLRVINAAAGHHIYEGRWLRNSRYLDDYVRFWYGHPEARPHLYTEWLADAVWNRARVTGDFTLAQQVLPGMVRNYEAWEADSLHPSGLFWAHDLADAMEVSISGDGFRPSINSYQYGNALAIARLAERCGNEPLAKQYAQKAATLKTLMNERLWDAQAGFYKTWPLSDGSYEAYIATAGNTRRMPDKERSTGISDWDFSQVEAGRNAREIIGYLPWYFGMPDPGHESAWAHVTDPAGFWGAYGLRTAERRHPRYAFPFQLVNDRFGCQWNGPSWPFSTSLTLTALAKLLHEYPPQSVVTPGDYFRLLKEYAGSHCAKGAYPERRFWLDEDIDPDTGEWNMLERRRGTSKENTGRDYNHSTFNDLIISGLLGVRPTEDGVLKLQPLIPEGAWPWFSLRGLRIWHHDVDVLYTRETGLKVFVDGSEAASCKGLSGLEVSLA